MKGEKKNVKRDTFWSPDIIGELKDVTEGLACGLEVGTKAGTRNLMRKTYWTVAFWKTEKVIRGRISMNEWMDG